jgi:eukaryotic-like serine/threonine-protein kinase
MPVWNPTANELFLSALEIEAPDARQAHLDAACGNDTDLRKQVEALLQAHVAASGFLERPVDAQRTGAFTSDTGTGVAEALPGDRIGSYRLLQSLGEGGMGAVWVAEQDQPVKRRVALKLIKAGMDSTQVLRRFEAERQALALMDHQNIAKVFDAGTTPQGRPYFAMELIKGVPITKFCDQEHLTPRERLELFLPVCQAVQHAHQKGVIHRDLKPSNVLIGLYDGKPVPKVIDFGVAKATGQRLNEQTIFTEVGQIVGTLEYMAPEQAELNNLDIDTRADIYSLGVILYELLAGSPPFTARQLRGAAFTEMLRMIREVEPPKPSTRLSSSDELPSIAANRKLEPKRLTRAVHGDLDWIVMKAIDKDRGRRYETANGLGRDIQRYLSDEPVEACPPSATYRLRKFAHKNRAALSTAAAIVLLLVSGLTVSVWQAVRASRAAEGERLARIEAQEQKESALLSAAGEAEERKKAEAKEAEANAVVKFFEDKIFAAARPEGQDGGLGREVTLRKAIEASLPFVEESFTDQPLIEMRLRRTLGFSFSYLGEPAMAAEQDRLALDLCKAKLGPDHPDTLRNMNNLASSYADLGRLQEALALREETLKLQRAKLGPDHPDTLRSMNNLGNSYAALGRHQEALALRETTLELRRAKLGPDHPDTLASMMGLGNSYADLGRRQEELALREETHRLRKSKLGPDHPDTIRSMMTLANCYSTMSRHQEARSLHEETYKLCKAKLGPNHPDTLRAMNNLANNYSALGRQHEALALREETLSLYKAKLGSDHPDTLRSMMSVANSYYNLGRHQEALALYEENLKLRRDKLGPDHSDTLTSMNNLAITYADLGRHQEALALHEETLKSRKAKLGPDHPDTAISIYGIASTHALMAAKSPDPAKEKDLAMDWLRQAVAAGFKNVKWLKEDKDLDALREREDFKTLLAELLTKP